MRKNSQPRVSRGVEGHEKLLITSPRRRGFVGDECQLEVVDDSAHHGIVGKKRDDTHLAAALGQRTGSTSYTFRIISTQPLAGRPQWL